LGTPLLCWNSGKLSFLVCFFIYTSIGVQLFKFHVGYGKGSDLLCAAGGVVLGIEMWLFLSKERNRV
jgi:hypothetical protein